MAKLIKKLLLSASVAAGVSTVGAVPAIAADFTTTGVTTENYWGQELTTADVIIYETETKGEQTYTKENTSWDNDNIISILNGSDEKPGILDGDSSNPGGNIELFGSSEVGGYFWDSTSLTGNINGQELTLSSLSAHDWFWDSTINDYNFSYDSDGNTLASYWFTKLMDSALSLVSDNLFVQLLIQDPESYGSVMQEAYDTFFNMGGFQAASDPNISYINSDGNDINIGLAGHYDLSSLYSSLIADALEIEDFSLPSGLQASEVVKYYYGEGETAVAGYLYSFTATDSKLYEKGEFDERGIKSSHTGNYEVTIAGAGVASVPEPSTMIGLMTVGGLLAAAKKKGQSKKEA